MELVVFNTAGKETGNKVTLNDAIFGIEPNNHAIYLDVKQYLANQRQGTHKAKQRNEVAGSTKKLKKQKGTGGARCGSIKSPVFVGGGRIFGPVPRDYSFKLNKKLKQLARKSALAYKAQDNAIMVVENFTMEAPKTKGFMQIQSNLGLADAKLLVVVATESLNIKLSARNLERVKVIDAQNINTYDVMNYSKVLFLENSLEVVNAMFGL